MGPCATPGMDSPKFPFLAPHDPKLSLSGLAPEGASKTLPRRQIRFLRKRAHRASQSLHQTTARLPGNGLKSFAHHEDSPHTCLHRPNAALGKSPDLIRKASPAAGCDHGNPARCLRHTHHPSSRLPSPRYRPVSAEHPHILELEPEGRERTRPSSPSRPYPAPKLARMRKRVSPQAILPAGYSVS